MKNRRRLIEEVDSFIKMTPKPNPFKDGDEVKEFYQKYMDKDEEQSLKDDQSVEGNCNSISCRPSPKPDGTPSAISNNITPTKSNNNKSIRNFSNRKMLISDFNNIT